MAQYNYVLEGAKFSNGTILSGTFFIQWDNQQLNGADVRTEGPDDRYNDHFTEQGYGLGRDGNVFDIDIGGANINKGLDLVMMFDGTDPSSLLTQSYLTYIYPVGGPPAVLLVDGGKITITVT